MTEPKGVEALPAAQVEDEDGKDPSTLVGEEVESDVDPQPEDASQEQPS